MVMSFFRRRESGMELITGRVVQMLSDVRHSFDLATAAVLHGASSSAVAEEIRRTDEGINRAEQDLRRELIVHITVQGAEHIGDVMAYTLLIKRIERIGDQAKNIFELTDEDVSFAEADDREELQSIHTQISAMLGEVVELILDPDSERMEEFRVKANKLQDLQVVKIRELMHSEMPGSYAVPRAVLHRYLKRVLGNLVGIVSTLINPIEHEQ